MARSNLSAADVMLYPATVMLMGLCLSKRAAHSERSRVLFHSLCCLSLRYIETVFFESLKKKIFVLISAWPISYFCRCHIRVIDTFGTEPAYNHEEYATLHGFRTNWGYWNLHGQQYMTMFRKCQPSSPCSARKRACLECVRVSIHAPSRLHQLIKAFRPQQSRFLERKWTREWVPNSCACAEAAQSHLLWPATVGCTYTSPVLSAIWRAE